MNQRFRTERALAALTVFCLISGMSILVLLRACERCATDNAYLGELFLGPVVVAIGLGFGLTWLVVARREGLGLIVGAPPGLAIAAAILLLGTTRTLVPPALSGVELLLLIGGAAITVKLARIGPPHSM